MKKRSIKEGEEDF